MLDNEEVFCLPIHYGVVFAQVTIAAPIHTQEIAESESGNDVTDDEKEVDVSDSDSLTDVTDDTMSCDSDLLNILGEEPRHETVTLPRQLSPIQTQFDDRKDRDFESLELNDLMIMFTENPTARTTAGLRTFHVTATCRRCASGT